jgi:hypothetical protein
LVGTQISEPKLEVYQCADTHYRRIAAAFKPTRFAPKFSQLIFDAF